MKRLWHFSNGSQSTIIEAIDGPSAWRTLASLVGVRDWNGKYKIQFPNAWSISCVCDCGKVQATRYCSKECFDARKTEIEDVCTRINPDDGLIKNLDKITGMLK